MAIDRYDLYIEYIKELGQYDPVLLEDSDEEIRAWAGGYITNAAYWIDLYNSKKELCGFLIIAGQMDKDNCHPFCNYYICQAYVQKPYRKQGIMTCAMIKFITKHPGVYGYDVIFGNDNAEKYWQDFFGTVTKAHPIHLPRMRSIDVERKLNLHGFEITER